MVFTPKDWKDFPLTTTPVDQAALEDMETRLSDYTDEASGGAFLTPSGGNDRTAIQAAVDATGGDGVVQLGPGTFLWSSGGPLDLPTDADGLTIRGSGRGVTTVQLSSSASSLALFNRSADNDTFQNITIEDLTIDANSVTGNALIGTEFGATAGQRINIDNIRISRIETVNVNIAQPNILLMSTHPTNDEGTQNTITDILVEDCILNGGYAGVAIMGSTGASATSVNIFIDNVTVRNVLHDCGSTPVASANGAGVQIGSIGFGGKWLLENVHVANSPDVGFELDCPQNCTLKDCTSFDQWGAGFLSKNFHASPDPDSQVILYDNCGVIIEQLEPTAATQAGEAFAPCYGSSQRFGHAILRDCWLWTQASTFSAQLQAVDMRDNLSKLTIDGFSVVANHIADTSGGSPAPKYFWIGPTVDCHLTMKRLRFLVSGSTTNATSIPQYILLYANSGKKLWLDIDGSDWDIAVTGLVDGSDSAITITGGGGTVKGRIASGHVRRWSANGIPRVLYFDDAASVTISDLLVTDWDTSAISSSLLPIRIGDQRANIKIKNFNSGEATAVASVAGAITLPFGPDVMTLTGTAAVTSITSSYKGRMVTLVNTSTASLTDGSNLKLAGNGPNTADDSITLVCDGTNWIETGRSVN